MGKLSVLIATVSLTVCTSLVSAQQNALNSNGNVGIGTTAPNTALEIKRGSGAGLGPVLRLTGGGTAGSQCAIDMTAFDPGTSVPPSFRLMTTDAGDYSSNIDFQIKTGGAYTSPLITKMTLTSPGNLGVGVTNPFSRIQAVGNITATTTTDAQGFVQLWADNALIWKQGTVSNGLRFGSATDIGAGNFSEKMRIMDNGAVCIGTVLNNPPDYKLFVESGIRTRKVKVDALTWPDYVFHANYSLRPLSEVEQYIKVNGHLPDVPSEEEVKKEGINLGDNQATLLKKVEELTLYVIEQNKKQENQEKLIQEQSKLLQSQQLRLEELEKKLKEKH